MSFRVALRALSTASASVCPRVCAVLTDKKRLSPEAWKKLTASVTNLSTNDAIKEIREGTGFVIYTNLFSESDIKEANRIIDAFALGELEKAKSKVGFTLKFLQICFIQTC